MPEREIMIIGGAEAVKPFLALGVRTIETSDPALVRTTLRELTPDSPVAMVFITETLAEQVMAEIDALKTQELPAVFILPEYGSEKRLGLKLLEKTMAKAVGKKI